MFTRVVIVAAYQKEDPKRTTICLYSLQFGVWNFAKGHFDIQLEARDLLISGQPAGPITSLLSEVAQKFSKMFESIDLI